MKTVLGSACRVRNRSLTYKHCAARLSFSADGNVFKERSTHVRGDGAEMMLLAGSSQTRFSSRWLSLSRAVGRT